MKNTIIISLTLITALITPPAFTANQVVNSDVNGGYIKEWLVLGPFFPDDLETDFLSDVGGEVNIQPKEGDTLTTTDGTTLTWKRYTSKGNIINLLEAIGNHKNATAYAFCVLQSGVAGEVSVEVSNDDGITVLINGKQMYSYPTWRYLSFDSDVFDAVLTAEANRCLVKVSQDYGPWGFAMRVLQPNCAFISGTITDEKGEPISSVDVRLEHDEQEVAQAKTNPLGSYGMIIFQPVHGLYNLSATRKPPRQASIIVKNLGSWQLGIRLHEGEPRTLNLTLKEAISIKGKIMMLDDATPHVAVPVQAVRDGKVIDGMVSDEDGKYRFINLKPGQYQVRCYIPGEYVYYGQEGRREQEDKAQNKQYGSILRVEPNKTLANIDFRIAPFKKGTWKNYDVSDGLPHVGISTIHQDSDGTLWFGISTNLAGSGVSRFDGKEFVNFTTKDGLVDDRVWSIYSTPDRVMWFGTYGGGVSRYDGKEFVNFTTKDGLAGNRVLGIYRAPDGVMWFGTDGGISRYDGKEFVNFTTEDGLAHNWVNAIHRTTDGVMWFGTGDWNSSSGGVSQYDGKEFINFTTKDGLASNYVTAINQTPDGVLWFGTRGPFLGGVSRYDGKEFINFTQKDGLPGGVFAICHSPDGVVWFATGADISRYDGRGFVNFTTGDGSLSDDVRAIHREPDGTLWFGTFSKGIFRYDEQTFVNFTTGDGLAHNLVQDTYRAPNGILWIATVGGVSRYDGKRFVNFTTEDGLVNNWLSVIHYHPDGTLWFGAGGYWYSPYYCGVSRYDGKEFKNFTIKDGLANDSIHDIHLDPEGILWFGTGTLRYGGGVSRYDGKEFVNLTEKDGLVNNTVTAIDQTPDGMMWFGTYGGVSRYDGKEFRNFTAEDGLAHDWVWDLLCAPDGVLWFGTHGGVSRYDGDIFVNFTQKDGLASNLVLSIYRDVEGVMWFGTIGGVSIYDGVAWTLLDTYDGLAGNKVHSIDADTDGTLWFSTERGLTHYRRSKNPPKARIVSVRTNRDYTEDSYRGLSQQVIPSITAGDRVTIEYNAIDFKTLPKKRQYRCRILEVDDNWRKPTKSVTFDHTFKKPGTYTFEVQAIDRDLNYSEPAVLTLRVKRAWWVFALFGTIGISIPLIVVGFYLGKRLQTQRAIAQQFNPYIAGRVVGEDLFYGRNDLLTDIERTLANNCFLLYGERRIGKTSLQHQLKERLSNADDPTYKFIPAYIDLQGVAEDDFSRTIATGIVEHAASLFTGTLTLRLNEGELTERRYSYRDLTRDLRTIIDHLKEGEKKTIKLVLLMDEIDTLNEYSLRTNLNLRGLFMGPFKENLVLVMSGLYLKMDWSEEGGGSPPFNFLSREIQLEPLNEDDARKLITEPVKGFYTYEPKAVDLIIELSELRPFTIQGFCLRAVARILADGRTKITVNDIEAIKDSVLAELSSIRGECAGTSLPASLNEALALLGEAQSRIADLEAENERVQEEGA